MSRAYRLKVNKIPLNETIPLKKPSFSPLGELYLDLIETTEKIKKNAPKPVLIIPQEPVVEESTETEELFTEKDDFALKELEELYNDSDAESVFSQQSVNSVSTNSNVSTKSEQLNVKEHPSVKETQQEYEYVYEENTKETEEETEERERKEKNELLYKFSILKKKYDGIEIPDHFSIHTDLETMKEFYEKTIRRVSLDSNVQWFREILGYSFFGIEFVSVQFLDIDMTGFTEAQLSTMNSYDNLLYELGEKKNISIGSKFPVEVRLLGYVCLNAAMFYFQKRMFSGNGGDLSNIMGMFMKIKSQVNNPKEPATNFSQMNTQKQPNKQKMRGPTITPRDVEMMNSIHDKHE